MVSLVGNLACGRTSTKVKAATKNGAVAQPPKRKTEVKAKKGFTTSAFCFKFNSCEQKNSKARIVYRNFGKKSTIKISDADRNKNIEAQRALSGKHPA